MGSENQECEVESEKKRNSNEEKMESDATAKKNPEAFPESFPAETLGRTGSKSNIPTGIPFFFPKVSNERMAKQKDPIGKVASESLEDEKFGTTPTDSSDGYKIKALPPKNPKCKKTGHFISWESAKRREDQNSVIYPQETPPPTTPADENGNRSSLPKRVRLIGSRASLSNVQMDCPAHELESSKATNNLNAEGCRKEGPES